MIEAAVAVAELTHHDPVGGDACALWCLAIRHAVLEAELPSMHELVDWLPRERRAFWRERVAGRLADRLPRARRSRLLRDAPLRHGVYLSGVDALDDLPADVTAVVSLCRLGMAQVRPGLTHAEFRIIDTDAADNPNLDYAVDDAARTVQRLRAEGHIVLLHCVAAQSRTPTVAARYGQLLGRSSEEALREVCAVLPAAALRPAMRAALEALDG